MIAVLDELGIDRADVYGTSMGGRVAQHLATRIPGARLHLVPGARHAYFEEFRTLASPLVLDFLTTAPHR